VALSEIFEMKKQFESKSYSISVVCNKLRQSQGMRPGPSAQRSVCMGHDGVVTEVKGLFEGDRRTCGNKSVLYRVGWAAVESLPFVDLIRERGGNV